MSLSVTIFLAQIKSIVLGNVHAALAKIISLKNKRGAPAEKRNMVIFYDDHFRLAITKTCFSSRIKFCSIPDMCNICLDNN